MTVCSRRNSHSSKVRSVLACGLLALGALLVTQSGAAAPMVEVAELLPSDMEATFFGQSVAIDGDTAIVGDGLEGASFSTGAAYVFERDAGGPGAWGEVKKLTASDSQPGRYFGRLAGISGDTAIAGMATGNFQLSGGVYVFERDAGGAENWGEVAKLSLPGGFGEAAAIDGDTIVVSGYESEGRLYVFERNQGGPGSWGLSNTILPPEMSTAGSFGLSVALSGDTVLVGAHDPPETPSYLFDGHVYVFERDQGGAGNWGLSQTLEFAEDGDQYDDFGSSVAIDGDTAIVGAPSEWVGPFPGTNGAAHVYYRNEGGPGQWGEVEKLRRFSGWSGVISPVAISGDIAMAGTHQLERDAGGVDNWGLVSLVEVAGSRVALSGSTTLIGAPQIEPAGRAYVLEGAGCTDNDASSGPNAWFGYTVPPAPAWIRDGSGALEAAHVGCDSTDLNDDNDLKCTDGEELGGDINLGGMRNPLNPWDFADVPTPVLRAADTTGVRNGAVTLTDALAPVYYSGTFNNGPPNANGVDYDTDLNSNGVEDGAEYDRTANGAISGPPNGAITLADALVILNQVGDNCAAAPN